MSLNTDLTATFQRVMVTRADTTNRQLTDQFLKGQHGHAFFAAAERLSGGSGVSDFLSMTPDEIECCEPERFVPATVQSMFPNGQFPVFFFATEGMAFNAEDQSQPLSAVYIANGLIKSDDVGKMSEYVDKTGFLDFQGTLNLSETVRPQLTSQTGPERNVEFSGEQSEFFASLENIACVISLGMAVNVRPAKRLEFEPVVRTDVSTIQRRDCEPVPAEALETATLLGEGVLTWKRVERVQDRYGTVMLIEGPLDDYDVVKITNEHMSGQPGILFAQVVATRPCETGGDWFRQISHTPPRKGELIRLGTGTCFFEGDGNVGVKPDQDRDVDWMNPHAVFRCDRQSVRLYFLPEERH